MEDCTIKFGDDVGSSIVPTDNDERAIISRTHLAVKRLFYLHVADKYEISSFEVKVFDILCVVILKADCCLETSGVDLRV